MAELMLKNVSKIYGKDHYAVKDFSLEIDDQEFIILVGPSGCGKSTTLRMIAGLEEISKGELWIDGKPCNHVESKERELSMVFQNYALYPHMTVYENMAFSLSIRKVPKSEIKERVYKIAKLLEIEELLNRKPKDLSGGQKQRVAIGSAIIRNPKALLMDEPLSNLDAKLRTRLRVEMAKLHKELGLTIVYVTHDQTEAMTLGTRIVVMKDGLIQQVDTPRKLYENPVNLFVATFIGSPAMNLFETEIIKMGNQLTSKINETEMLNFSKWQETKIEDRELIGEKMILGIRPEDMYDAEKSQTYQNITNIGKISALITGRELLGSEVFLYFQTQKGQGVARVEATNEKNVGDMMEFVVDMDKVQLFSKETEENIFYDQAKL